MQTKTWLIALGLILLAVAAVYLTSDQQDAAVVEQLARQEAAASAAQPNRSTVDQTSAQIVSLTQLVSAERGSRPNYWLVEHGLGNATVTLPFLPTGDGRLPRDATGEQSDARSAAVSANEHIESNPGFVGEAACAECHRDRHDGFIHTAHHKTSGLVSADAALGHFTPPRSAMTTSDPELSFVMSKRDDRCFQRVLLSDWHLDVPLDVFTGSAKSGQTFLYWQGDALYQAFVSYLTQFDRWIPSPGYRDIQADYSRPVRLGCLECHVTYIAAKEKPNVYHRDSAVWGVSCERCHGPGRAHVEFHRAHPDEKNAKHIVHPSSLPRRQRQLDICGQCHSGGFSLIGEAFSFRPGDDLSKYHELDNPDFEGVGGIHTSNQLTRLSMSQCFQKSQMTCTSCHDPHQDQHGDTPVFTKSCQQCHQPEHCGMSDDLGDKVAENCVSCHMPIADTKGMTLRMSEGSFTVSMIDHYIRVDRAATDRYLNRQPAK